MLDHNNEVYKKELLGLFRRVDQVFIQNGIRYYATDGTCLGAIREKGFIPWDDDVDLVIWREDFQRAIKVLNESDLQLYTHEFKCGVDGVPATWGRVFNRVSSQSTIEQRRAYVDIDVLDYAPDSKLMFCTRAFLSVGLRRIVERRTACLVDTHPLLYFLIDMMLLPLRVLPTVMVARMEYKLRTGVAKSKFVRRNYDGNRVRYPARLFERICRMPFSGFDISVPAGYEELLMTWYGDWRTPPPVSERRGHSFGKDGEKWTVPLPADEVRRIV